MKQVLSLKKLVKENENFRKVIASGKHTQVVLMSLAPGEELGDEIHPAIDQLFLFEDGKGEMILDGKLLPVEEHDGAFVPAGTKHNLRNSSKKPLKFCTIYSPPAHAPDTVLKVAPKMAIKV